MSARGSKPTTRVCGPAGAVPTKRFGDAYSRLRCVAALLTRASLATEARAAHGIDDGLVRLSFGVEHVDDLRAALAQALARI